MRISLLTRSALILGSVLLVLPPALAQQAPGWFVPPGGGGQAPAGQPRPAAQRPAPRPAAPAVQPLAPPPGTARIAPPTANAGDDAPPVQVQLPPVPDLPAMPRASSPPAAVIGVLGIPDIMRASNAAQQVEKTIGERREKLNEDAQKEQAAWRDLQQALANQRAGLSADQIRAKERELQERITNAQRVFRDRNRIIQEAGQYGLAQIERMLIGVIRQVAESRGMNLVLHRAQVALNINEFDITEQVAEQMNKVLPSVSLPPEGVSPVASAQAAATASPSAPASAAPPPAAPAPAVPAPALAPAPAPAPAAPMPAAPAPAAPRR